jgi:hypothetical protein
MISIMTLSLLVYFIYILIDIVIYVLGSTPWSSEIYWMVGRVIKDPSLGLPSPYEVVLRVLIVVTSTCPSYSKRTRSSNEHQPVKLVSRS